MDLPPLSLDPWVKTLQEKEKASWKGISIQNFGYIGEGLKKKTLTGPNSKTLEKLRNKPQSTENILKFTPITESQLIKTSLPSNMFSKGNIFNRKYLKYKIHKAEARLVRSILEVAGFSYTDSHDWTVMWLGCNAKLYLYEGLNPNQRINHFPNSYEITRKDRMCINLMSMQRKHGLSHYGFFPETYIIPNEFNDFCLRYRNDKETKWIVKPSNSSQGRGIFLLDNLNSLRSCESCVVSRFIHNPLLINDLKFDLRIYVLVTCFEPLKIYVYDEGLARFASEKYSEFSKNNKFCFLTNYSVNKQNDNFIQNEDAESDNVGHKWSFSALVKFLKASGVDTELVMVRIYDLIIKTVITAESTVVGLVRKYDLSRNNCFDLFGFDILLDESLRPWLLEVNLSPSLATESPLDLNIKSNLVSEIFSLIGIRGQSARPSTNSSVRLKSRQSRPQTAKSDDTAKYNEILNDCFSEFLRSEHFVRVYPVQGCQIYDKFFTVPRKINKVLYNALYNEEPIEDLKPIIITGEDLLIEYLIRILASSHKIVLNKRWENSIQEFVNNEIWKAVGIKVPGNNYLTKLSGITAELKKRNTCLSKSAENSEQKLKIIAKFTHSDIENSLKGCKNEIVELVSCFFKDGVGIVTQMQDYVSFTPKQVFINIKSGFGKNGTLQQGLDRKEKYLRSTSHVLAAYGQKKLVDSWERF